MSQAVAREHRIPVLVDNGVWVWETNVERRQRQEMDLADSDADDFDDAFDGNLDALATESCRCGGTKTAAVEIHGGRSTRLDCAKCGRFVRFGRWNSVVID